MKWRLLLGLLAVNLVYLILGGTMFHLLESRREDEIRQETRQLLNDFLKRYECVDRDDFEKVMMIALNAYNKGLITINNTMDNTTTVTSNWDIYSSIFFSGTVVTTIGYGHISPSTEAGKAVCVLYAIVGIPLMLVMLAGLGEKLLSLPYNILLRKKSLRKKAKLSKLILVLLILLLGMILFLVIPAAIMAVIEDWTYGQAFYYAFISLSTIGFGDFVVGQSLDENTRGRGFYRLCACVWLLVGLAWLASVISGIQQLMSSLIEKVEKNVVRRKQLPTKYELRQEAERAGQTKAEDNDIKTSEEDDHTWMLSSTANSLDSPDLHSTRV